ncbi:MAG: DUF4926 domain-containing protein [Anaerolineaceae bacterium]|nr:DUF4926 domain-containing protein [Anaerolineaceae bacterium]
MMIAQYKPCTLTTDLPQYDLRAGTRGIVVDYTSGGKTYIVEFFTPDGETIDVIFVEQDQVRPAPETMPAD